MSSSESFVLCALWSCWYSVASATLPASSGVATRSRNMSYVRSWILNERWKSLASSLSSHLLQSLMYKADRPCKSGDVAQYTGVLAAWLCSKTFDIKQTNQYSLILINNSTIFVIVGEGASVLYTFSINANLNLHNFWLAATQRSTKIVHWVDTLP